MPNVDLTQNLLVMGICPNCGAHIGNAAVCTNPACRYPLVLNPDGTARLNGKEKTMPNADISKALDDVRAVLKAASADMPVSGQLIVSAVLVLLVLIERAMEREAGSA